MTLKHRCSWYGLFAIVATAAALALSSVSFFLPLWSTQDSGTTIMAPFNTIKTSERTYGVWGVCSSFTDYSSPLKTDNCFPYFTSTDVETFAAEGGKPNKVVHLKKSLCSFYHSVDTSLIPAELMLSSGKAFLHRVCTNTGQAMVLSAILAPALTLLSLVFMLFSCCCCSGKCASSTSLLLLFLSLVSSIVATVCWSHVSTPLFDDDDREVSYGPSFFIAIAGTVVTVLSGIFLKLYANKIQETAELKRMMAQPLPAESYTTQLI